MAMWALSHSSVCSEPQPKYYYYSYFSLIDWLKDTDFFQKKLQRLNLCFFNANFGNIDASSAIFEIVNFFRDSRA